MTVMRFDNASWRQPSMRCQLQAAVEAKQEELRRLDRGAAAVHRAAQAPCTDLNVGAVLQSLQTEAALDALSSAELPRPLTVLARELQLAAQVYGIPAQVRCLLQCSHTCRVLGW